MWYTLTQIPLLSDNFSAIFGIILSFTVLYEDTKYITLEGLSQDDDMLVIFGAMFISTVLERNTYYITPRMSPLDDDF